MSNYVSGTAGRVSVGTVANFVAGIKSWKLDQTTAEISLANFESYVDGVTSSIAGVGSTNGRVWPDYIPGLSGATGTLEGLFFENPGTDTVLTTGVYVTLALIFDKSTNWGYGVYALVTAFGPGTNVDNQPAQFTLSFRVKNAVPLSAILAF